MELGVLLGRCKGLEKRAAAVYRTFADRAGDEPAARATWTALAAEEDSHAHAIERAAGWLDPAQGWHTALEGWDEALDEIETRLAEAERPETAGDADRRLVAALALERTELDTLFRRILSLLPASERPPAGEEHVAPLLAMAARSADPTVAFEAALLHARQHLQPRR